MNYQEECPGEENPLIYFDAIFYIYHKDTSTFAMSFLDKRLESDHLLLKMAIITDESGRPDLIKTKQVIFNKAKRHNFQKVLTIRDFPEEFCGELISHLRSIVQHMKTQEWKYWHICELTDNHLESIFSEVLPEKEKPCFSMAFNRKNLN